MESGIHDARVMSQWARHLIATEHMGTLASYVMSINFLRLHNDISEWSRSVVANDLLLEVSAKFECHVNPDCYWSLIRRLLNESQPAVAIAKRIIHRGPPKTKRKEDRNDRLPAPKDVHL